MFARTSRWSKSLLRLRAHSSLTSLSSSSSLHNVLPSYRRFSATSEYSEAEKQQAAEELKKNVKFCIEQVRERDDDGLMTTVMLPKNVQNGVFVLRAFNTELSSIKESARAENARQMRFMWWSNALEEIADLGTPKHPAGMALAATVQKYKLNPRWLNMLVDARAHDLGDSGLPTMEHVEQFGEGTVSALLYLTLQVMGINSVTADHAASHIGKCIALTNTIRSLGVLAPEDLCMIPNDVRVKHNVIHVCNGLTPELQAAVFDVACRALAHLEHARKLTDDVPKEARAALLPAVLAGRYLDKLQEHNFDPFVGPLQPQHLHWLGPARVLAYADLYKHSWKKTY